MTTRLSLKQQLAELSQPAPVDLDPEDALAAIDDAEHRLSIDRRAATDHYIPVASSSLRKFHDSVSDPKYDGIRTSRKQLYDNDDEAESGEGFADDLESDQDAQDIGIIETGDGYASPRPNTEGPAVSRPDTRKHAETEAEGDLTSNLRKTHEADKKKGLAVSRQIAMWDMLLDTRIQLQKAVTAANCLPQPDELKEHLSHPLVREALEHMLDVAENFTDELALLQQNLLRANESIDPPPSKRRKVEGAPDTISEHGEAMTKLSEGVSALEACYHPWAVDTLSKWSAKVQAVAPNVLLPDNRGSFLRDGKSSRVGVVGLVDQMLGAERTKLLDRTRRRRDGKTRIGQTASEGGDEEQGMDREVFDDTDYYQQLLRDVIVAREGDEGEPQWQQQQRERKARRKRTVDTKASKGRKLRYEVHAKLQNFMVPVPVAGGEWHEEQIDGLFSSLLQT
ncbi:TRAUB-domain-containing protein [Epithele typhae]|uniref:TRAUB-domain-containing protein n=1 Tax=Epithele typhae TaxID=378194 RepID=UPI002007E494|nr:TRAUB-domain-containing protein [Epithele typhae]KAH9935865.1 TRAUB-domain-containing protein [Epithele typhae]